MTAEADLCRRCGSQPPDDGLLVCSSCRADMLERWRSALADHSANQIALLTVLVAGLPVPFLGR
jgi:ribosomal protein L37E